MTDRKVKSIVLAAIMVLSVVAIAGHGLAAEVARGGDSPTFNPGVGGPSDVVISPQKTVVFRGEDDFNFVDQNGSSVDPANLIGTSGDAEGIPLESPIPQDQTLGQYALNGQSSQPGVTVQQPRVTELNLYNERGADVADSSVPDNQVLLVRARWNYQSAEDLDINVLDERGNEITGDVLTSADQLSDAQRQELSGPYADNPQAVGNPGQRGTGTEIVYLQGAGQFNESELANTTLDAAYWVVDLSDQDAGQYSITVEGWDNLDFGPATQTTTVQLTSENDITLDLGLDEATRGQYVPFTIRGSTAGNTHFVAIEDTDFRNNKVDERVFRDVDDTQDRGVFDSDGDGTPDFAWAEIIVNEDTGLGRGQIDTAYLDDTNVDVNLFAQDLTLDEVANSFGNPEDDDTLRVTEGQLAIEEPFGTYIAGQQVDLRGTASSGTSDVALYARDQGDWELLDVNEDGQLDEGDLISVDANGEWLQRDVRLSQATDILAIPGRYRLGVIDAEDARDTDGNLRETLTTTQFSSGTSEQTSILVTEPGLGPEEQALVGTSPETGGGSGAVQEQRQVVQARPLVFKSYNRQIATDDGAVDVLGIAPGQDDVLVVMVDTRGRVATEQVTVDDNDVFDKQDIPLTTQDGRELNEGPIVGLVYAIGRDGVAGDGILPGETRSDLAAAEDYVQGLSGQGLTQSQVLERFAQETTSEAGSDDLVIRDEFRYTDGSTTIDTIRPQDSNLAGINEVQPGDTMVVSGVTNRKPDDNTIAVDITDGPDATAFPSGSTDTWNYTGRWTVTIEVPDTIEPGTYTLESDDGSNTDIVNFDVVEQRAPTPGNGNETNATNATVSFANQTSDGASVTVESASLPDGGFVVLHDGTLADGDAVGSVVGASDYLEPGAYENVTVQLDEPIGESGSYVAMLHQDTNANQTFDFVASNGTDDGPYTMDGEAVTDDGVVTIETGNATATPESGNATETPA